MSLKAYINEASDVLFRFGLFTIPHSSSTFTICADEHTQQKMFQYLGEFEETDEKWNCTLLSVLEHKLSEERHVCSQQLRQQSSQMLKFLTDFAAGKTQETKRSSFLLYQLLCHVCGSSDAVDGTRLLYAVLDDCTKVSCQYTNVSSGSRAEGVHIPDCDYDIMTILEQIVVYAVGYIVDDSKPSLICNTENSYPGFAHLIIPPGSRFSEDLNSVWGVESVNGPVVSNRRFKEYFMSNYRDKNVRIHGPCISPEDDSAEWRLSFSLAERELIHSWNHTQVLCYVFFKYIKKDLMAFLPFGKLICSYFIKTTLFWLSEEQSQKEWNPNNILACFHELQKRLMYWLRYGFCPHYFIPENNLFDGILNDASRMILENAIKNLLTLVLRSTHYGDAFKTFHFHQLRRYSTSDTTFVEKKIAILSFLKLFRLTLKSSTLKQIRAILSKSLRRLLKQNQSYFPKGIYLLAVCYANQIYAERLSLDSQNNKERYVSHKNIMSRLIIGTNSDAIAGWSLVAMYFCKIKQYGIALHLIEKILQKCSKENKQLLTFVDNMEMMRYFAVKAGTKWYTRQSFLQSTKNLCMDLIYQTPTSSWLLEEFLIDTGFQCWRVHPVIFTQFLHFVIFNRTGKITRRDRAIRDIIISNRESRIPGFYRERLTTFILLTIAYKLMNDELAAEYWLSHAYRFGKKFF
ncbi:uncharacterized protein LOC127707710 [Mytilus californianus]|uniref:uncharacterized protein LOC127707710 n=1 Tax=Mytilus californianus TaxID=6549 RepID=UPI002247DD11|nr:uncharacterized protein LOC127707710 [Mytilus californianus]